MSPSGSKIICPGCRAAFDADTNYCSRCGTSLGATPAEDRVRKTEPFQAQPGAATPRDEGSGPRDLMIGRVIDGRYKVLERLASGGMGIVYKVEHQRMGKIAAMKVLHRDLAEDREIMKRFRREAEAISKLSHPNTVQTFDFGAEGGAMYLVMEYIRGEDLGTLIRRDGPMPFARAAPIMMQVCEALSEAHDVGIIHRDLKPENILVTHGKDGHDHAKVLDFGLAKLITSREPGADASSQGEIVGTPFYMSPEQIQGDGLDGRADIYSLGGVMYRVLTGEPPFQAESPVGVLTRHLTDEVVPATKKRPELPARVDEILGKALAKNREDRYATTEAMRADLADLLLSLSSPRAMPRVSLTVPAPPRLQREDFDAFERSLRWTGWARLLLIPIVVGAAVAGTVIYMRHEKRGPRDAEAEPNNDPMTATLIASGVKVRGTIGRRITTEKGDDDFFQVDLGGGTRRLRADVTPIPNINLTLAVFDEDGRVIDWTDRGRVGEGEQLDAQVSGRRVFIEVLERKGTSRVPTENLTDEYRLNVTIE